MPFITNLNTLAVKSLLIVINTKIPNFKKFEKWIAAKTLLGIFVPTGDTGNF